MSLSHVGREEQASYFGEHIDPSTISPYLGDADEEVAIAAMKAVVKMQAWTYAPSIANGLERPGRVRVAAALALSELKLEATEKYTDQLVRCLSGDTEAKVSAIVAMGRLEAASQRVLVAEYLSHENTAVAAAACVALGHLGPNPSDLAKVAAKLDDDAMRHAAVTCLATVGDLAQAHVDIIIERGLNDVDSRTRAMAAAALQGKSISAAAMAQILQLLQSEHAGVRCSAALAISSVGKKADSAGTVAQLLQDDAEDTSESLLLIGGGNVQTPATWRRPKCAALFALGRLGASSYGSLVADAMQDENYEVRVTALESLGELGDQAVDQFAKISACLDDSIYLVRAKACEIIGLLKAEDEMADLPMLFEDKSPAVRRAALAALTQCPHVARAHHSEVFKFIDDECPMIRAAAVRLLGNLGDVGQPYASVLAQMLYEPHAAVREAACEALGCLGEYGASFSDELSDMLQDQDQSVRMAASQAMTRLSIQGLSAHGPTSRAAIGY